MLFLLTRYMSTVRGTPKAEAGQKQEAEALTYIKIGQERSNCPLQIISKRASYLTIHPPFSSSFVFYSFYFLWGFLFALFCLHICLASVTSQTPAQ